MPGIGKNATVAEGAWSELHLSAAPGEHAAFRDQLRRFLAGRRQIVERLDLDAFRVLRQRLLYGLFRTGGPAEWDRHAHVLDAIYLGGPIQRGPERRSIV